LEKLVPHLGTLEKTIAELHETKELARKTEHALRNQVAELQDANFELSGSSKGNSIIALSVLCRCLRFNNIPMCNSPSCQDH
jgi:hypothetical protein